VDSGLGSSVDDCVLFVASPIKLATSWEFVCPAAWGTREREEVVNGKVPDV